ncbi:MAG: TIGR01777 family oxidoreductase [Chitinophagaceae bacterium]
MKNILIAGGTGLVGRRLTEMLLVKGYSVTILTRTANTASTNPNISYASWDTDKQTIDEIAIAKADAIVNLAGAGVADKRWSVERKKEILESRVNSGRLIVNALQKIQNKVEVVINASAIGWYASNPIANKTYQEEEPANTDFLGETCKQWEQSIHPVSLLKKRLIKLRIGIVLAKDGGALKEFLKPLKFGIATLLGNGKQKISWIHIDDLCRMFIEAIENENLNGVYNAVAPSVTTNSKLNIALAKKIRGRFFVPVFVPKFILKIVLGEMSIEVLKSSDISCKKIHDAGFQFLYPTVETAVDEILK